MAVIAALIFIGLRLFHLEERVNFGADQGLQLLQAFDWYQNRTLSLIGPYSSFTVEGRHFFFGPAPYYLAMAVLAPFNWHPLAVSFFLIILACLAVLAATFAVKRISGILAAGIFFLLNAITPFTIEHTRFYWNPNFLYPFSLIILALLVWPLKKVSLKYTLLAGLLSGFSLQFHYSFLLAVPIIFYLLINKRMSGKHIFYFFTALLLGFFPVILFELRNNFYNLKTIILFITSTDKSTPIIFQNYYLLAVLPFIFCAISIFLSKLKDKRILIILLFSFTGFAFWQILPTPKSAFMSPNGWNYLKLQKAVNIVLQESKTEYNIVDLLSGDSRAMAMRYLLTIAGDPPLNVEQYPSAKTLFIYSRITPQEILAGSMWEIDSLKPATLSATWQLSDGINLYRFDRLTHLSK